MYCQKNRKVEFFVEKEKSKLNISLIIKLYIIIQPIIDIITSLCVRNISPKYTIGMFVRTFFMGVLIICTFFSVDKKSRIKMLVYYGACACYFVLFLGNSYLKYGTAMVLMQVKGLIKSFYLPIILVSFFMLLKNEKVQISKKSINIALLIYTLSIVIGKYFSIGYSTYLFKENLGTIGLFYAGNEVAVIIALISPIYFAKIISDDFRIQNYFICFIVILAMLEIGTKVGFFSIGVILAMTAFLSFVNMLKNKKTYKHFLAVVSLILITVVFLGNTSVGKNLQIKPLAFKEQTSKITTTKTKTTVKKQEEIKTYVDNAVENPEILLSGRNKFLNDTIKKYINASNLDKALGIGYVEKNEKELIELKLVEMDYFDIFFSHGIVGTIIYMTPILLIILPSIFFFFKRFKININNNLLLLSICSVLLGFGIALFAGHVFTAPAVSTFLALVMMIMYNELYFKKEKEHE